MLDFGRRMASSLSAMGKLSVHLKSSSLSLTVPALNIHPTYHYVWLRDNCQCPHCLHPSTRQKLISSAQIPLDIKPQTHQLATTADGQQVLHINWSHSLDGVMEPHESIYPLPWLIKNQYTKQATEDRSINSFKPTPWSMTSLNAVNLDCDYQEFTTDEGLLRFMDLIRQYGFGFITNTPTHDPKHVETLAERFGPIRESFYGRSWDVESKPDAKNIAYTSLFLGLHMDLMYFEAPPGLQFLHCLESSVQGGESIFVDSYKAVEILKHQYPREFEVLCEVPVTFHYENNGHHLRYKHPTIIKDGLNQPYHIYYAPPFQAPLETTADKIERFYAAFKVFGGLLESPGMVYQRKMTPGECVVFANRRVLHGRQSFDARSGNRHLKGTYVDWDVLMDRYRVLSKTFNPETY